MKKSLALLVFVLALVTPLPALAQVTWMCVYDFTTSSAGFTSNGAGTRTDGVGWVHTDTGISRSVRIKKEFGMTSRIRDIRVYNTIQRGTTTVGQFWLPATTPFITTDYLTSPTTRLLPDVDANSFQLEFIVSNTNYSGSITISRIDIGGVGASICETGTPTPSPTPTMFSTQPTGTPRPNQACMNYLPCGPIPWSLPEFYQLQSPTPVERVRIVVPSSPTAIVTWIASGTPAPSATPTATPGTNTPTPTVEFDDFGDQLGTLEAITAATPVIIRDINGNEFSYDNLNLIDSSQEFWGYVKAVGGIHFGVFTPIILFLFFSLAFILVFQFGGIVIGIVAGLVGLIRKAITFILDFLPL